jgi:hypothetical protein
VVRNETLLSAYDGYVAFSRRKSGDGWQLMIGHDNRVTPLRVSARGEPSTSTSARDQTAARPRSTHDARTTARSQPTDH